MVWELAVQKHLLHNMFDITVEGGNAESETCKQGWETRNWGKGIEWDYSKLRWYEKVIGKLPAL